MKSYIIIYTFNHSRMGFQNQITVLAENEVKALDKARTEVMDFYKERNNKKFSFKLK